MFKFEKKIKISVLDFFSKTCLCYKPSSFCKKLQNQLLTNLLTMRNPKIKKIKIKNRNFFFLFTKKYDSRKSAS